MKRTIPGWSKYKISSTTGKVYRKSGVITDSMGRKRMISGRVVKQMTNKDGYKTITLSQDGRQKTFLVNRLVLKTFVGPCPKGKETLHKNGVASDNALINLCWGTPKKNYRDKVAHGTTRQIRIMKKSVMQYLTSQRGRKSQSQLARELKVDPSCISRFYSTGKT